LHARRPEIRPARVTGDTVGLARHSAAEYNTPHASMDDRGLAEPTASEILLRLPEPRSAEGRLVLAVLLDAVALLREDAFGRVQHPRAVVRSTLDWVFTDEETWPLSFVNVCSDLGLEPAALRAALERELQAVEGWFGRVRGGAVTPLRGGRQPVGAAADGGGSSRWSTTGPAASQRVAARRPDSYIESSTSRSK
jgi:hypothetical protein